MAATAPAAPPAPLPSTLAALPPALLEQLPFFVYGTLQTGFTNHASVVRGRHTGVAPAWIPGAEVWHFTGFPGLYESPLGGGEGAALPPGSTVVGQLLTAPGGGAYYELLEELDALEEFFGPRDPRNVYERVVREVRVARRALAAGAGEGGEGGAGGAGASPAPPSGAGGVEAAEAWETVRAWVYVSRIDRGA